MLVYVQLLPFYSSTNRRFFIQNQLISAHRIYGDTTEMKRLLLVPICIVLMVCALAAATIGTAIAAKAGFTADTYTLTSAVTIDGKWTTSSEWTDATTYPLAGGLNGIYRVKWYISSDYTVANRYYLVEIVGDTTSDSTDSVVVCEETTTTYGGAQRERFKFEINGTGATATKTVYKGTPWALYTGWTPDNFNGAATVSTSQLSATPHKIIEFKMDCEAFGLFPEVWELVAAYDASNSASGMQVWPTGSSVNSPNDYGLLNLSFEPIPEGFSILAIVILSAATVAVGARFLRKPKLRGNIAP